MAGLFASRARRGSVWVGAALATAAAALLWHVLAYDSLQDDAFISLRYARNWLEGEGLAFNKGEAVEGYSNFLWVALVASVESVLGVGLPLLAEILGVAFALATLGIVVGFAAERCGGDLAGGLMAALLLAGSGVFAAWGRSGLETTLFCALVAATLWAATRAAWFWAAVAAGLATLTRPEGGLLLAVFAAGIARGPGWRGALGEAALGYALTVVPWTLWRLFYYGHVLPNTVVAKMGMALDHQLALGFGYLAAGVGVHVGPALLGVAAAVVAFRAARRPDRADALLLLAILLLAGFATAAGGDWMPAYRMLAPTVALACVALARAWHLAFAGSPRARLGTPRAAAAATAAAALTLWLGTVLPEMLPRTLELRAMVDNEVEIGKWFARRLPPETLAAAFANGAIPYYSRLRTIDLLGLTDEHIARRGMRLPRGKPGHIAHDMDYVVERAPAVITFMHWDGLMVEPNWDINTRFMRAYTPVVFEFTLAPPPTVYANVWVHRSDLGWVVPRLVDPQAGIRLVPDPTVRPPPPPVSRDRGAAIP